MHRVPVRLGRQKWQRDLGLRLVADLIESTLITFRRTVQAAGLKTEQIDEVLLVGGMTCMPAVRDRVVEVSTCPPASGVHPDLVVAVGAAVQAALLTTANETAVLMDVTPHNLGIMTVANLSETILPRNTKIPATQTRRFVTVRDNQEVVKIVVFQGDERIIEKNEILGEFHLEGIRKAPAGDVQIDVKFDISAEGMVSVTATEVESGKAQVIRITNRLAISEADLNRMIEERKRVSPDGPPAP
jgi:molecular chaperone DnaK